MMDRAEAERALASTAAEVRLAGARFFSRGAAPADIPFLKKCLAVEPVPWIRRALDRAVDRASKGTTESLDAAASAPTESEHQDTSERLVRDLRAEAVEEVAGTILHEFAPIIGALRLRAREEIAGYESSQTRKLLDQLLALIEAVRNLKRAAAVPHYAEFDLADLVDASIQLASDTTTNISIRIAGQRPFLVYADREAMQLALLNGLRNAIEAVSEGSVEQPPRIVINWGRGGVENWLVVLDSGAGFVGDPAAALKLGATNKRDHIGYGLATAQYAMRSMEGDVLLSNNPDGGARFELRWDEDDARTVR